MNIIGKTRLLGEKKEGLFTNFHLGYNTDLSVFLQKAVAGDRLLHGISSLDSLYQEMSINVGEMKQILNNFQDAYALDAVKIFLSYAFNGNRQEIANNLQPFFKRTDFKLSFLRTRNLKKVLTFPQINETSTSFVLGTTMKRVENVFVIKTAKGAKDIDTRANLYTLYEHMIGIECLNEMRQMIPNFLYTFYIFRAPPISITNNEIDNSFLTQTTNPNVVSSQLGNKYYNLIEYIEGETLESYLADDKGFDLGNFFQFFLSILLSLDMIYKKHSFLHNNLSVDNVILRKLEKEMDIQYIYHDKIYSLRLNRIPTLINYQKSQFFYQNTVLLKSDKSSVPFYKLVDVYRLVLSIIYMAIDYETPSNFTWLFDYFIPAQGETRLNLDEIDEKNQLLKHLITEASQSNQKEEKSALIHQVRDMIKDILKDRKYEKKISTDAVEIYIGWFLSSLDQFKTFHANRYNFHPIHISDFTVDKKLHKVYSISTTKEIFIKRYSLFKQIFDMEYDVTSSIKECEPWLEGAFKGTVVNKAYDSVLEYLVHNYIISKGNKTFDVEAYRAKKNIALEAKVDDDTHFKEFTLLIYSYIMAYIMNKNITPYTGYYQLDFFKKKYSAKYADYVKTFNNYKLFLHYYSAYGDKGVLHQNDKEIADNFTFLEFASRVDRDQLRYRCDFIFERIYAAVDKINSSISFHDSMRNALVVKDASHWVINPEITFYIENLKEAFSYLYTYYPRAYDIFYKLKQNFYFVYLATLIEKKKDFLIYTPSNGYIQLFYLYKRNKYRLADILSKHVNKDRKELDAILESFFTGENGGVVSYHKNDDITIYRELSQYRKPMIDNINKKVEQVIENIQGMQPVSGRPEVDGTVDLIGNLEKQKDEIQQEELFIKRIFSADRQFNNTLSASRILDFGGGDGSFIYALARRLNLSKEQAIRVDIPEYEDYIVDGGRGNIHQYIDWKEVGEYEILPFPDHSIDVVTMMQVLHHVLNKDFVLKEISRILKPGGILYVKEHNCENVEDSVIVDIEHSLFDLVRKGFSIGKLTQVNKYISYYINSRVLEETLSRFGFTRSFNKEVKDSLTRVYHSIFVKTA